MTPAPGGLVARDIMTPLGQCVREDMTLREAAAMLVRESFAPLPLLTRDGALRGSVYHRHLVLALANGAQAADPLHTQLDEIRVGEFRPHRVSVAGDCPIAEVGEIMKDGGLENVRVEDEGALVGVVATEDMRSFSLEPPDGIPFPPPRLIELVQGGSRRRWLWKRFYESGKADADAIRGILASQGYEISRFESILDFGCGCGRLIRHWKSLRDSRLYGLDYNPALVDWCRENLPFAEFAVNGAAPPLPLDDRSIQLVYAFSVFTHLDAGLQRPWIEELRRVVGEGGLILLTLHGSSFLGDLDAAEESRFRAGELVVVNAGASGRNECAVYHPERYIRETLAAGLELVSIAPTEETSLGQDAVVLRRP